MRPGSCGGKRLEGLEVGLRFTRGPCGEDRAEDRKARHWLPASWDLVSSSEEACVVVRAGQVGCVWGLACGAWSTIMGFRLFLQTSGSHSVLSNEVTLATNLCLMRLLAVVWVLLKEVEKFVVRVELSTIWWCVPG